MQVRIVIEHNVWHMDELEPLRTAKSGEVFDVLASDSKKVGRKIYTYYRIKTKNGEFGYIWPSRSVRTLK